MGPESVVGSEGFVKVDSDGADVCGADGDHAEEAVLPSTEDCGNGWVAVGKNRGGGEEGAQGCQR